MSENQNEGGGRPRAFSLPAFFPYMMPCLKFAGGRGTNEMSFKQWKCDLETWFRMYAVPVESRLDWVINCLDGEARREVAILPDSEKDTVAKVFQKLQDLYASPASASVARSLFFNCRQQSEESVRVFALRLQECWQKMMVSDAENILNPDVLMRDQFIAGLFDGGLKRDLRLKVTLDNTLKFADVKTEAVLRAGLEEDGQAYCGVVKTAPQQRPWEDDLQKLKVELKTELTKEVELQVNNLSQTLLQGIREEFQKARLEGSQQSYGSLQAPQRSRSYSPGPRHQRAGQHSRLREYDEQGRPICFNCRTPGHIARQCTKQHAQANLN